MTTYLSGQSPIINVMTRAIQKATTGLVRDFGELENLQVSKKGPKDFVSAADLRSEKIISEELIKARPDFGLLLEESGEIKGNDPEHTWIVDPLDGTKNFLHGNPHFAISIALKKGDDIISAATYSPIHDEMFIAEKGRGAFLNNRRIRVSGRNDLSMTVLGTGLHKLPENGPHKYWELEKMNALTSGIRCLGSATLDLAYVACGRLDGMWARALQPWDLAAGMLLISEAGGSFKALSRDASPLVTNDIIASNGSLTTALDKHLRS